VLVGEDWATYWRAGDRPVEAMRAHFRRHTYHRHSHETYSFGLTESGAQAFTCRGAARTSAAGMVMVFNPDEPHDGHSAVPQGFTYTMIHLAPELITDVLTDGGTYSRTDGRPLFADSVLPDVTLANALRRLHTTLRLDHRLARDEALSDTVRALVRRATRRPPPSWRGPVPGGIHRARDFLHSDSRSNISAAELAAVAGCSRYALHRGFLAGYGLPPSDYQRQLRLRTARRLLAAGTPPARAAAEAGFADQSHLTRWFTRCYGITPATFRAAGIP
jgi:AraC-like DNA-binding protein